MNELKAVTKLEGVHLAQTLNYPEAYKPDTGLLINFGSKSLEFRRMTYERTPAGQQINEAKK